MHDGSCRGNIENELTQSFPMWLGIHTADGLNPMISDLVLDYADRKLSSVDTRGTSGVTSTQCLEYADRPIRLPKGPAH